MPFPDGTSLTWWGDPDRLHAELAKISPRDAKRFADYEAFIERAASVMDRFILRNPPSWAEVAAEFRTPADLTIFQKCFLGSAADIAEHFFESEKLQAVVAATGIIGTSRGPRDAGTGYVKLYHSMGMATGNRGAWTYVKGAMGAVTQALARVATARGAVIRTGAEVRQILIRDGRATGLPALRRHGRVELLSLRHRLCTDLAGGHLRVLRAHRVAYVDRRDFNSQ